MVLLYPAHGFAVLPVALLWMTVHQMEGHILYITQSDVWKAKSTWSGTGKCLFLR